MLGPCMQGAAEKRELQMPEFQRLNLGMAFFALTALGVHAIHWDMLRPAAALTAATVAGITAAAPAFYYSRTSGHGLAAGRIAEVIHVNGNHIIFMPMPGHTALQNPPIVPQI